MILDDGQTELDTSAVDDRPDSISRVVENVATFELRASTPTLLHLSGELDLASAPILQDAIAPVARPGATVEVDLTALTFIDSSGIKVLCHTLGGLGGDGRLVIRNPTRAVRRTLQLTGLDGLFEIVDDPIANAGSVRTR
jgi:anti-sigma B factor antagonist